MSWNPAGPPSEQNGLKSLVSLTLHVLSTLLTFLCWHMHPGLASWNPTCPNSLSSNLSVIDQLLSSLLSSSHIPFELIIQPRPLTFNTPALQYSFLSPLIILTRDFLPSLSKLDTKHHFHHFLFYLPAQSPNLDQPNYLLFPIFIRHSTAHCCFCTHKVSKITCSFVFCVL